MAWTNITNAQLAIGAPVRSIDLLALRDNITAQANGDAGAPKQQTAGIADNAVTAAKVNKGNGLGTSGTQLVLACPSYNSIGSYAIGSRGSLTAAPSTSFPDFSIGSDYSSATAGIAGGSGTWRCMGYTGSVYAWWTPTSEGQPPPTVYEAQRMHLFCKVA